VDVNVFSLVPNAALPTPAPAATRPHVPPGYGVQEQCLPFTAAAGLGCLIPAPFDFGLCPPDELPAGAHAFRAPLETTHDARVFYVRDNPEARFVRNAFSFDPLPFKDSSGQKLEFQPVQPGLSFFDRADQADLFKIHLPFVLRTPTEVDSLFLPAINRAGPLTILSGLVETDWYANPVNLVARRPPVGFGLHVLRGNPLAQVVFVARAQRRAEVRVGDGSLEVAQFRNDALGWQVQHAQDRGAYKKLARSHHGRVPTDDAERTEMK
jgi:hypothetical protein